MQKKILCDWRLTDDMLDPIRLGSTALALDALISAGVIEKYERVVDRLKTEWVCRRTWRYTATFTNVMPTGVRKFLRLDGLRGAYRIVFNGSLLFASDSPFAEFEITNNISNGAENTVEIEFPPDDNAVLSPSRGFCGSMYIRDTGATAIRSFNMRLTGDGEWRSDVSLSSLEAGEFEFRYSLERNDGTVERALRESVPAGDIELTHTPFGGAIANARADVTLSIMDGIRVIDESYYTEYISDREAPARGFMASDLVSVEAAARAGANCVCARADASGVRTAAGERGLTLIEYLPSLATKARVATQPYEKLLEMAGGDETALESGFLWRLSGGEKPAVSAETLSDTCALSRYYQATELRDTLERARLKRDMLLIGGAFDERPACASCALFDFDGHARPAYTALSLAWRSEYCFARAPSEENADGIVAVPIFYVSDKDEPAATINAKAYSSDGRELVSANYPVLGRATDVVGRLCVDAPDDGVLLVRVTLTRFGEYECASDCVIAPNGALQNMQKTQLLISDERVENAGDRAAIGVHIAANGYFGFMLPKQKIKLNGARESRVEGVNTYI